MKREAVFVDTSGWYALTNAGDIHHERATQCLRLVLAERRTLILTNHVASETYTLLRVRLGAAQAGAFLSRTRDSAFTERVFVPGSWEEAAEDLLMRYQDQDFSYVDATSFIVMRRLGVQQTLAFDHHFSTMGFTLYEQ